jgi:hypothetical protein
LIDFCGGGGGGGICNYLGGGDGCFFLIILAGSTFSLNLIKIEITNSLQVIH